MLTNFMDYLIDWREFEEFVKKLHDIEGNFIVERNIEQIGNSGARRQIDVRLTQKTKSHEYVTIIECKRWKRKVNRHLIDELYTTIEDLNASKGIMFTTLGYEEGAVQYAKYKNIDIFVVRDLTDEEWGLPGREIRLYFRMFSANFENIRMPHVKAGSLLNLPFKTPQLEIEISQEQKFNEILYLYSNINNSKGKHLLDVLFDTRRAIMGKISQNYDFDSLCVPEFKIAFDCDVTLDFTKYEFCILNYPDSVILWLDKLHYKLPVIVHQYKFQHDRGNQLDFALIVENYITKNPTVVFKPKQENKFKTDSVIKDSRVDPERVLQNDTGFTIYSHPWVKTELSKEIPIVKVDAEEIDINRFYNTPSK